MVTNHPSVTDDVEYLNQYDGEKQVCLEVRRPEGWSDEEWKEYCDGVIAEVERVNAEMMTECALADAEDK